MDVYTDLKHWHGRLMGLEVERMPLPDEKAREAVIGEINYRAGRLAALLSLPFSVREQIDPRDIEDEIGGAWRAVTFSEALSAHYAEGTHAGSKAAEWFGLTYA